MIEMHEGLAYARADEVAECYDGVSETLYNALWRIVNEGQDKPQESHDDIRNNTWFVHLPHNLQIEANEASTKYWKDWP